MDEPNALWRSVSWPEETKVEILVVRPSNISPIFKMTSVEVVL